MLAAVVGGPPLMLTQRLPFTPKFIISPTACGLTMVLSLYGDSASLIFRLVTIAIMSDPFWKVQIIKLRELKVHGVGYLVLFLTSTDARVN